MSAGLMIYNEPNLLGNETEMHFGGIMAVAGFWYFVRACP